MAYRALYREYRPQRFADIVGQSHITRTLQNALDKGRINHAYLFCGPRGTGKTTTAKVLAKTLNCLKVVANEPCNQCDNCISTNEGSSVDVIEIDAASNRGIEDIRELRENVKFSPASGKYRVYIIDEVHMLTAEAFNALLKTLEEPPGHVIFILATTEPHKVPLTILSRCQRFDFRRIGVKDMLPRLKQVAEEIGLEVEDQALVLIARAAEGGLRDALGILDQGSVFGNDSITVDDVHKILGTVKEDVMSSMVDYLAKGKSADALLLVNELLQQGKDLRMFVKELNGYLRSIMLYLISNRLPEAGDVSNLKADAAKLEPIFISNCLEVLTRLEYDMKWSAQPVILLELALVKLTGAQPPPKAGAERQMPQRQEAPPDKEQRGQKEQTEEKEEKQEKQSELNEEKNQNEQTGDLSQEVKQSWGKILDYVKKIKPSVYGVFREAFFVEVKDKVLTIAFKPQHANFHKVRAEQGENKKIFEQALNEVLGGSWSLKIIVLENQEQEKPKTKGSEENPLVQKAVELFGEDKVEIK
ncbi:DNA polymerase III subunit gamma/tau [Desulfofalx alkaliphila]|uniref:DNA polymerase III subunit gamma/tau n=1 Tax=Desulfofalx alkaliphila TaxID=105483 RepID=UPI0004E1B3D8|nr:DNA polymerase III subunit gamma/tau [Desulfofalx alkaliphila]